MIYPEQFPYEEQTSNNNPERIVFQCLKPLSGKYEIFYSRRIKTQPQEGTKIQQSKKSDLEIDFIIISPQKGILLLEVKGGNISFDGKQNAWYQNGKPLDSPHNQVLDPLYANIVVA